MCACTLQAMVFSHPIIPFVQLVLEALAVGECLGIRGKSPIVRSAHVPVGTRFELNLLNHCVHVFPLGFVRFLMRRNEHGYVRVFLFARFCNACTWAAVHAFWVKRMSDVYVFCVYVGSRF